MEYIDGDQSSCAAQLIKPPHPSGDVAYFVAINAVQNGGALRIADTLELGCHFGCDVEPARLEHERNDGETGKEIFRGRLGRFPEAIMSREVAILGREVSKSLGQQLEMDRFLRGNTYPIVKEGERQRFTREPRNYVPGEVDGVKFDMCEGVKQCYPPRARSESSPLWHFFGRPQQRFFGTLRPSRRDGAADSKHTGPPDIREPTAGFGFCRRICDRKDCDRAGSQSRWQIYFGCQRACAALSTWATCPGTFTLCHTPRTTPS